jgi:hypothetical protein
MSLEEMNQDISRILTGPTFAAGIFCLEESLYLAVRRHGNEVQVWLQRKGEANFDIPPEHRDAVLAGLPTDCSIEQRIARLYEAIGENMEYPITGSGR